MQLETFLRVGEKVEITFEKIKYSASIQDITSNVTFCITQPSAKSALVNIRENDDVHFTLYRSDCLYEFEGKKIGEKHGDNVILIHFMATSEPIRTQRRNAFRFPVKCPMQVRQRSLNLASGIEEERVISATSCDISEGGAKFMCKEAIMARTTIMLSIQLPNTEPIGDIRASVVRCIIPHGDVKYYTICVKFLDSSEFVKKVIRKFIIDQQIRKRKYERDGM